MDRDKLKERMAWALRKRNQTPPYNAATQWHDLAEAALTAIESSGYVIMPKDEILRKMSTEEFTQMMAGIRFKEPSDA